MVWARQLLGRLGVTGALSLAVAGCQLVAGLTERSAGSGADAGGGGGSMNGGISNGGASGESGTGAGNTGGTSNGGAQGGNSGSAGVGGGKLGTECNSHGERGCDEVGSRQLVVCDTSVGRWVANGACPENQRCNSAPGSNVGTCQTPIPECEGRGGERVCIAGSIRDCGPEGVSAELVDACADSTGPCATCRPEPIATSLPGGSRIVVTSESVVVGGGGGAYRVPQQGGDWTGLAMSPSFAVDDSEVFFADEADRLSSGVTWSIWRAPNTAEGMASAVEIGRVFSVPRSIEGVTLVLDTSNVLIGVGDAIHTMPRTGGTTTLLWETPEPMLAGQMVRDSAAVYWADETQIHKLPLAGGTPVALAPVTGPIAALVAFDDTIYWSSQGDVLSVSTSGGDVVPLLTGAGPIQALAVDAGGVYATETVCTGCVPMTTDGRILRVPLAGGKPDIVSSGLTNPTGIALDADHVFWTVGPVTYTDRTLVRLARNP